jgi:uncharacterized phage protein gp47/JayE
MPLDVLSIEETQQIYETELAEIFEKNTPLLPETILSKLSFTWAGADQLINGFILDQAKQAIIDTAETEHLERWAAIWGITRKEADFAQGDVIFTGVDTSTIPAGTSIKREDGVEFETDALGTISGGTATVAVTAVEAGSAGSTAASTILALTSPVSGIDSDATVDTGGITGGADQETDDALRARLLNRIQKPPQGGSANDFEQWTLSVSGVTRAFIFENHTGIGNVGVTFVLDDDPVDIIPNAGKLQEVEDFIEPLRPITSNVIVFAPVAVELDMTINITPNTSAVQAAITAELEDLMRRDGEPGATILLSRLNEAVSIAEGEEDHVIVTPSGDVAHAATELPVLGTITFGSL